jgi:hypothetical protein
MGARIGRLIDYIDEDSWRFGLALTAIGVIQLGLLAIAVATVLFK